MRAETVFERGDRVRVSLPGRVPFFAAVLAEPDWQGAYLVLPEGPGAAEQRVPRGLVSVAPTSPAEALLAHVRAERGLPVVLVGAATNSGDTARRALLRLAFLVEAVTEEGGS